MEVDKLLGELGHLLVVGGVLAVELSVDLVVVDHGLVVVSVSEVMVMVVVVVSHSVPVVTSKVSVVSVLGESSASKSVILDVVEVVSVSDASVLLGSVGVDLHLSEMVSLHLKVMSGDLLLLGDFSLVVSDSLLFEGSHVTSVDEFSSFHSNFVVLELSSRSFVLGELGSVVSSISEPLGFVGVLADLVLVESGSGFVVVEVLLVSGEVELESLDDSESVLVSHMVLVGVVVVVVRQLSVSVLEVVVDVSLVEVVSGLVGVLVVSGSPDVSESGVLDIVSSVVVVQSLVGRGSLKMSSDGSLVGGDLSSVVGGSSKVDLSDVLVVGELGLSHLEVDLVVGDHSLLSGADLVVSVVSVNSHVVAVGVGVSVGNVVDGQNTGGGNQAQDETEEFHG